VLTVDQGLPLAVEQVVSLSLEREGGHVEHVGASVFIAFSFGTNTRDKLKALALRLPNRCSPCFVQDSRRRSAFQVPVRSNRIRLLLNSLALLEQGVERFDLIEEQPVVDHLMVVGGQLGQGTVVGHQAQATRDGCMVVDQFAL